MCTTRLRQRDWNAHAVGRNACSSCLASPCFFEVIHSLILGLVLGKGLQDAASRGEAPTKVLQSISAESRREIRQIIIDSSSK